MFSKNLHSYQQIYNSALIFNLLVGGAFALAFEPLYLLVGGDPLPQQPIFQLLTHLVALAIALFGILYYLTGCALARANAAPLIILCIFAKLAFVAIMIPFAVAGDIPLGLMPVVAIDFVYSLLFSVSLFNHKQLVTAS